MKARPVVWLPEADAELTDALSWYRRVRPELAVRFAVEVADTVERISAAPLQFAAVAKGRRRALEEPLKSTSVTN